MTKKQMRKLAQEIVKQNKIHDSASSLEEKSQAEKRIYSITQQILSLPHGLEILGEVDAIAQTLL